MQVQDAQVFLTPTPFNTLLWRAVVVAEDNYLEGFDSLLVDEGAMRFTSFPLGKSLLEEARGIWAVERLRWFARGFVRARVEDDRLVVGDLRMGQEPVYVFSHVVAARGNPHWTEIPAELLPVSIDDRALTETWDRIWRDSDRDNAAIERQK